MEPWKYPCCVILNNDTTLNSKSNNNNLKSSLEGKASVSLSLGTPNNEDWSEESFIDINGDGLGIGFIRMVMLG